MRIEQKLAEHQTVWANKNKLIHVLRQPAAELARCLEAKTFVNEQPTIWIEGRVEAGKSILVVRDNGTGIDAEHLDKIFDPFFTTKDVGEGMGLGLTHLLPHRAGMRRPDFGADGAGQVLRVYAGISSERAAIDGTIKQRVMENLYDYKKFAILYVDDEEKSLKYFTRAFQDQFRILTATNAQDGLKLLEEHKDDIGLLMTDQRMPGEKGVWLLEKARQLRPRIIRILATAYADMDAAIAAVNTGRHLQIRHQALGPAATGEHAQARPGVFHGPARARPVAARENVRAAQHDDRRPDRQPGPAGRRA